MLKGFESKDEVFREIDVVHVELRDIHGENPNLTELIAVSNICFPISNQTIELTQATHNHLITLPLAENTGGDSDLDVEVLIGGDYYWSFLWRKHLWRDRSGCYGDIIRF